jgi:hypothetical protein
VRWSWVRRAGGRLCRSSVGSEVDKEDALRVLLFCLSVYLGQDGVGFDWGALGALLCIAGVFCFRGWSRWGGGLPGWREGVFG